jgi:hypothetical protein
MGILERPIGVNQIKGDLVTWVPAVDVSPKCQAIGRQVLPPVTA